MGEIQREGKAVKVYRIIFHNRLFDSNVSMLSKSAATIFIVLMLPAFTIYSQSSFVYFNYPLQVAIYRLHKFGYQGIEIWGGRPHAYKRDLDDQIRDLITILNKLDMTVSNFIPAQFRIPPGRR